MVINHTTEGIVITEAICQVKSEKKAITVPLISDIQHGLNHRFMQSLVLSNITVCGLKCGVVSWDVRLTLQQEAVDDSFYFLLFGVILWSVVNISLIFPCLTMQSDIIKNKVKDRKGDMHLQQTTPR